MTKKTRRKIDPATEARIALAAVREDATTADLARQYQVHPNQIYAWTKQLLEHAGRAFNPGVGADAEVEREREVEKLHAKIGQLTVERDFLAKRSGTGSERLQRTIRLPLPRQRWSSLITQLGLTSNRAAVARREAPVSDRAPIVPQIHRIRMAYSSLASSTPAASSNHNNHTL